MVYQTPESCMSLQCEKGKPPPAFKRSIPVHFEMPTCVARARRARAMRLPHLGWDDGESLCNVSLEFLRVLAKCFGRTAAKSNGTTSSSGPGIHKWLSGVCSSALIWPVLMCHSLYHCTGLARGAPEPRTKKVK